MLAKAIAVGKVAALNGASATSTGTATALDTSVAIAADASEDGAPPLARSPGREGLLLRRLALHHPALPQPAPPHAAQPLPNRTTHAAARRRAPPPAR